MWYFLRRSSQNYEQMLDDLQKQLDNTLREFRDYRRKHETL